MPSQPPPSTSNSGIRQLTTGESIIPASKRADGSVRKEIRVKPGYKPPEDVEVYKNRTAAAWKNRGKGGVPGAGTVDGDRESQGGITSAASATTAAANKNAKRREARKKAAANANSTANGEGGEEDNGDLVRDEQRGDGRVGDVVEDVDPVVEKAKEARKLAKKLRQARELKEKKDSGTDLLPEQFAKVIKINELIRQLDSLGFDAEGEKKTSDGEERKETEEAA